MVTFPQLQVGKPLLDEARKAIFAKIDSEHSEPLNSKLCLGSDPDVFAVPLQSFPVLI